MCHVKNYQSFKGKKRTEDFDAKNEERESKTVRKCSWKRLLRRTRRENYSPQCPLVSPSFSPRTIQLAPHHLNSALYYLNACNSLAPG